MSPRPTSKDVAVRWPRHGYSRDSRSDRPQLVIGLLCAADGCPIAVEVFEGNNADPTTVRRRSPDHQSGLSRRAAGGVQKPLLAEERRRKRDELLAATEKHLARIKARVERKKRPLRGAAEIGKAVGVALGKRKMAKHFAITLTDDAVSFTRKTDAIAATVRTYKSLAQVERAFRCIKTVDLELRPVFHWTAPCVRARVLLS
jgi:transposase